MLCRITVFENCICVTKSHNEIKREFVLKNKILITVGYICVRLTLSFRSFLLKGWHYNLFSRRRVIRADGEAKWYRGLKHTIPFAGSVL